MSTSYRLASVSDAPTLAEMNHALIRDEGHSNPMDIDQLTERMTGWLRGPYQAVLFEDGLTAVGYALYRFEPDHVYLRHLFVRKDFRRRHIAADALTWLKDNCWSQATRIRVDVLEQNSTGLSFWIACGFVPYSRTLQLGLPHAE